MSRDAFLAQLGRVPYIEAWELQRSLAERVLNGELPDTVLLLDSSRIHVMPLAGRSFQFKPLAHIGDREAGQLIGEYTLELRNQNAHGVITGLTG